MRSQFTLFSFLLLFMLAACGQSSTSTPAPAEPGIISVTGNVHAPTNHAVNGTTIIACFVEGDDCSETKSRATQISQQGTSAAFSIDDLNQVPYLIIAWKDNNGNNTLDDNDLFAIYATNGQNSTPVTPPASNLALHLSVYGGGNAQPGTVEAGVAKGTARNSQGQALVGAHIEIRDASYRYSSLETTTDATGTYRVTLPPGSWIALGTYMVNYHGAQQCLYLERDSHEGFWYEDGAIRNFTLKINGGRQYPDGTTGYWGGKLNIATRFGSDPWGNDPLYATLRFVLEPDGLLMDGSVGERLEFTGTANLREDFSIEDIPLGRYRVEAGIVETNGSITPLVVRAYRNDTRQEDNVITFDDPTGLGCDTTKWSVVELWPND